MTTMLEHLAASIATWYPSLGGRSIAVSEAMPFKTEADVPTLPIAVVGMVSEENPNAGKGNQHISLVTDVAVIFMLEPVKYGKADGHELEFYAFYDYEAIRNTLLLNLREWTTPNGGTAAYVSMEVESNAFAVELTLRVRVYEEWSHFAGDDECQDLTTLDPLQPVVDMRYAICVPKGRVPANELCDPPTQETNNCPE